MAQADVIVPVHRDSTPLLGYVRSLCEHGGASLRRLILVVEPSRQRSVDDLLENSPSRDPHIVVVQSVPKLGAIGLCNLGLAERAEDAVLISGQATASAGWLGELAAVAHAEEKAACVTPLSEVDCGWSVRAASGERIHESRDAPAVEAACASLPRWTVTTAVSGPCIYLRGDVLDAVGLLDEQLPSLPAAIDDWVSRAGALALVAKRANRVFVHWADRSRPNGPAAVPPVRSPAVLAELSPGAGPRIDAFGHSLDAQLASHAIGLEATGKLRVAYDIRHVPAEQVGTRTYAISLARALAALPDIELTLLVRNPNQARGLKGRVVTQEQWTDDVALIHRPGQVIDRSELRLLFQSSAHVVITYQDLIAFRIPSTFPSSAQFEEYRATSRLTVPAAQRVIAYSESVRREIASEFGIPLAEIPVVPLGVEAGWFSGRGPRDRLIRSLLRLPDRYFFSVASDYPHKNLQTMLDAYARFRARWTKGEPPWLVLAGYTSGARSGLYPRLESEPLDRGVVFLGPVSRHQLRVLYQDALALVFSSLYEGFGLPPLEAMAARAPVIAIPISALPEVGGDCVLYPDGLSAAALARAMERLAASEPLRDELREKGAKWVEHFRWEKTALATRDVYSSTVLRPSERSLQIRRLLRDALLGWASKELPWANAAPSELSSAQMPPSLGVRGAWKSLQIAMGARLKRELRRCRPVGRQRTA